TIHHTLSGSGLHPSLSSVGPSTLDGSTSRSWLCRRRRSARSPPSPPPLLRPLATATAVIWIQPATALAAYCHYFHGHRDAFLVAAAAAEVRLPGLLLLRDVPSFLAITDDDDPLFVFVLREFRELVDVGRSSASRSQQESAIVPASSEATVAVLALRGCLRHLGLLRGCRRRPVLLRGRRRRRLQRRRVQVDALCRIDVVNKSAMLQRRMQIILISLLVEL
ncbi:unnamed protein product, partial [Urochloa humidicola]